MDGEELQAKAAEEERWRYRLVDDKLPGGIEMGGDDDIWI